MSNNSLPFEIIAAPLDLYIAPVGTPFNAIDVAPASPWTKVGSSGNLNYGDEGMTVSHTQAMEYFRAMGDAGSRKAFRTSEDLKFKIMLADISLEQYSLALNSNAVATTPAGTGTAGYKEIGLSRGFSVATVALIARGPSPYLEDGYMQFNCPRAAQSGNPEPVYGRKGSPVMLALEWTALVDPNAVNEFQRFGKIVAQHAAAL